MRDIRNELERAVERRAELWHELGDGVDPAKSAEAAELSQKIDELWAEARALRRSPPSARPTPSARVRAPRSASSATRVA
jgi:hypothetical protein